MGVEGIILAAGLSSRAKAFKMTLSFGGSTILENTIDSMGVFCNRILLVGGYGIERLKPIVEKNKKVELIFNESFEDGMYSSVLTGMKNSIAERVFFTPGDYPLIESEVYNRLLQSEGDIIIPTFEGRRGHPILFSKKSVKELLLDKEVTNLRDYIRKKGSVDVPVECRGILMDLDTMDDYERLLKEAEKREGDLCSLT